MGLYVDQLTINVLLKRIHCASIMNLDIIVNKPMMSLLSHWQWKTRMIKCRATAQS